MDGNRFLQKRNKYNKCMGESCQFYKSYHSILYTQSKRTQQNSNLYISKVKNSQKMQTPNNFENNYIKLISRIVDIRNIGNLGLPQSCFATRSWKIWYFRKCVPIFVLQFACFYCANVWFCSSPIAVSFSTWCWWVVDWFLLCYSFVVVVRILSANSVNKIISVWVQSNY